MGLDINQILIRVASDVANIAGTIVFSEAEKQISSFRKGFPVFACFVLLFFPRQGYVVLVV